MPVPASGDRVLLSGASGFLGRHLAAALRERGAVPVALIRPGGKAQDGITWNPDLGFLDPHALRGFHSVIHLSGEPVASLRWTAAKKRRILASRVQSTHLLATAIARCPDPPATLLCASGINIYGDCGEAWVTEDRAPGLGFLPTVCRAWEAAAKPAEAVCRVAHLRIGVVLGTDGGLLPALLPLFRLGLGGQAGSGTQWVSWIALQDLVRAVEHTLGCERLSGALNVSAPHPVSNREFCQALAHTLRHSAPFRMPAWLLRLLAGQFAVETILSSVRAKPQELLDSRFLFKHPRLAPALEHLLRPPTQ